MRATRKIGLTARLAAALALAFGLIGLAGPAASAAAAGSASAAAPASSHVGWLRLAHLSPNTPAVDVYLYSFGNPSALVVVPHVTYGTVSAYKSVEVGEYTVAMRGPALRPVPSRCCRPPSTLRRERPTPWRAWARPSGLRLQVLQDRLTTPPGKALIRIIQASLEQPKVTVTAGSHVLAHSLAFAAVTSYQEVTPGTWNVRAAGQTDSATESIPLAAGTIHTLVILDDPGKLSIDNLTDAAGSQVLPDGGAATGFGGTAAVPGSSLIPWLVILAAGLLVSVAGIARLRKSRGAALRVR